MSDLQTSSNSGASVIERAKAFARVRRSPLFPCALVLLVTACDLWLTNPSLYNTVTVIVTTENGAPIPGVALTLYTGQRPMGYASTGADGRHVFEDVPQGNYGVFAVPPNGYVPANNPTGGSQAVFKDGLIVAKDTLSPVRFTFLKGGSGTLVAMVTEPDGTPIPSIAVTASSSTGVDATAPTDTGGLVRFSNLPFGVYGLTVQRRPPYRDFVTPDDSPSVSRAGLVVSAGSIDTAIFRLSKCAGTLTALASDGTGLPVPNATIKIYTSTEQLAQLATDATGRISFSNAPCVITFSASITPPTGYSVPSGSGSSFFDGLRVAKDSSVSVTFHLTKTP